MQDNVVAKKIASEAKLAAKSILKNAQTECNLLQKKAEDFVADRKKSYAEKLEKKRVEIEKNNQVSFEIESKKFELFCKQSILGELCNAVSKSFLALDEKKLLDFVERFLQKNASVGDCVKVNFPTTTVAKVKSLKISKNLKLNVSKGDELGIVVEGETCNKSFVVMEEVAQKIENNQKELCNLLFD